MGAKTAEEIAEAVEIAHERDVGVRVAQRILDRREKLGGFTSLQQVADVPQVGPERFTEIVTTVGGRSNGGDAVADVFEIKSYKYSLRSINVEGSPPGPIISLEARGDHEYCGRVFPRWSSDSEKTYGRG